MKGTQHSRKVTSVAARLAAGEDARALAVGRRGLSHPALLARIPRPGLCHPEGPLQPWFSPLTFQTPLHPAGPSATQASVGPVHPCLGWGSLSGPRPPESQFPHLQIRGRGASPTATVAWRAPTEHSPARVGRPAAQMCKARPWGRRRKLGARGPTRPSPTASLHQTPRERKRISMEHLPPAAGASPPCATLSRSL